MVKYEQIKDEFILHDYDKAKTFSDFMPAVAGVDGVPLWVYFVNRGQCVCSLGVNDKNNSIAEFLPANKALLNVERLGFRTFIKSGNRSVELFADKTTPKKLSSKNNKLTITDTLKGFISAEVTYTQLARKSFPALLRKLVITNISDSEISVNCTDGLAQMVTYGITDYSLKNVSNLSCAYSNAALENGIMKYQVEYSTADQAKITKNIGANFYCSAASSGEKPFYIFDPNLIFGGDCSLTRAENLFSSDTAELKAKQQTAIFKMATAFSMYDFTLKPGESACVYSALGGVKDEAVLSQVRSVLSSGRDYEREICASEKITEVISKNITLNTGDSLFDGYIRQSFIDNVLRGGMPVQIKDKDGNAHIHYVFSRKHGDLEREYNWFTVPATKYSSGTGNYRDLCQNRRNDVFFFPFIGDYNVKMFYSFLQLDGYNPLVIKQPVYVPKNAEAAQNALKTYGISENSAAAALKGMAVNDLAEIIPEEHLGDYLSLCDMEYRAEFSEGYWTDHFTYNIDLIESYLKVYPDKESELLFGSRYKYFSSGVKVLPLEKRLVENGGKYYAYNSIEKSGNDCWYKDRNGKEVTLNLFGKLAGLALIKSATLDCNFIGLEMEGGKPGWNDAMNGMPGVNGSSVPEAMEVYRINEFLIEKCRLSNKIELLEEQAELLNDMKPAADKEDVYVRFLAAREKFRNKVYEGLSGNAVEIYPAELKELLEAVNSKIKEGISRAAKENGGIVPTFIPYEVTLEGAEFSADKLIRRKYSTANFLEANAKALKVKAFCDPHAVYDAVRKSDLYDKDLHVYKTSESLENESPLIGRVRTFSPGLYERESCFLHMHYKYLLSLLESGLYDEFYLNLKEGLVCYMDPAVYGRSVLQNSSFIVSSAGIDKSLVGRGFQPRLTGANAEMLSMYVGMFLGDKMFYVENGELKFKFAPVIHSSLFDENGEVSIKLFGKTEIVYKNPSRINTYNGKVADITLYSGKTEEKISGDTLSGKYAENLRNGVYDKIAVVFGK